MAYALLRSSFKGTKAQNGTEQLIEHFDDI